LGCKVITKSNSFNCIQFGPSFFIGVVYDQAALKDAERKAIGLEIRTADPKALKQEILAFGVKQAEFWDKSTFTFRLQKGAWLVKRKTCPNGSNDGRRKWQEVTNATAGQLAP
jgi:hypothetical protein